MASIWIKISEYAGEKDAKVNVTCKKIQKIFILLSHFNAPFRIFFPKIYDILYFKILNYINYNIFLFYHPTSMLLFNFLKIIYNFIIIENYNLYKL